MCKKIWGVGVPSMGAMGSSGELIPVFHSPHYTFVGDSHLGVSYRGALLGRIELEGGITSLDQYPKGP